MMEKFIGKKEKWTSKGNDKLWVAVSLIHSTTNHYQALYQFLNPESSSSTKNCDGCFPYALHRRERWKNKQK